MWVVWTWLVSESVSTGSRCPTTILGLARRLCNVHVVLGQWLVCSIPDSKRGPVWIRLWLCMVYLNHQCGMQIQSTSTVIQIHNRAPHRGDRWSRNNDWIKCKGYGMAVILFFGNEVIFTDLHKSIQDDENNVCLWLMRNIALRALCSVIMFTCLILHNVPLKNHAFRFGSRLE